MTLREAILDSLADDFESIEQIEGYLKYLKFSFNRNQVVALLMTLLKEKSIEVVYPSDEEISFSSVAKENINDFWFKMTEKGRLEWDSLEY